MFAFALPKTLAASALAVAALGTAAVAQAGVGAPQKHPDIIAVKHPDGIKVPDASKHPDRTGEVLVGLKTSPRIIGVLCRKAGGTQEPY